MIFSRCSRIGSWFVFFLLVAAAGLKADTFADKPLYQLNNRIIKGGDLSPDLKRSLYEIEAVAFERLQNIIDSSLIREHVTELAAKQKKPAAEVEKALFAVNVDEKQAQAWFDENKARLGQRDFSSLKNEIIEYLKDEAVKKKRLLLAEKLRTEKGFKLLVNPPKAPYTELNTAGYPRIGKPKGKVEIVVFADYLCPHCRHAEEALETLLKDKNEQVSLVFIPFPLAKHGPSISVAQGALCADQQGKFAEFHSAAFAQQEKAFSLPDFPTQLAKELKLDIKAFEGCQKDKNITEKIYAGRSQAETLGLQATPVIFINGEQMIGYDLNLLKRNVNSKLGKS